MATIEAIRAGRAVSELQVERDMADILINHQKIEADLGFPSHKWSNGEDMSPEEFQNWRRRAVRAKAMLMARYRELKSWLRRYRAAQYSNPGSETTNNLNSDPAQAENSTLKLLAKVMHLVDDWIAEETWDFELMESEEKFLDEVRAHLKQFKPEVSDATGG